MDDMEMLRDLADGVLEREADQLCRALLDAERVAAAESPGLLARLDASAAQWAEDRETWHADMLAGDLPPDHRALQRAVVLRRVAYRRMGVLLGDPPGPLTVAVADLWRFLQRLDDDQCATLEEYVAGVLPWPTARRYLLV